MCVCAWETNEIEIGQENKRDIAQGEREEVQSGGVKRNSEKKGKILTNIVHYNVN